MGPSYTPDTPIPESPTTRRKPYHFSTQCATVENPSLKDQYGSSAVPIYQTATFKGISGEYDYSRSGNPTRSHLEHHLAKISSARHAFTVSSGMAALDVITRLLKPGDEVIAGDDLYGGTNRLLAYLKTHTGVIVHHVDTTNPSSIIPFLRPGKTAMVLLESPTNPLLKIADITRITADVRERAPDAIVVVDNTMMSPYLQRPLEHGADIVYDSATKYLSGHHDLMAGAITCDRDDLAKQIAFVINAVGNALTPFDSFLLLRGSKTLAVRMDRQQSSAMRVATYLQNLGFQVYYPGLANHPGKDIHDKNANGYGAVLSFITGDKSMSERIVGGTRLWGISVSFGAVNSLISMPCLMSHASIDAATRAERGLPEDLIRLCVGIEDPNDLIDDLEYALLEAGAITPSLDSQTYVRTNYSPPMENIGRAFEKLGEGLRTKVNGFEADEIVVSAPGKVILFGEHAVVHGVTAIAASVDLRCYALTSPRHGNRISLHLPDLGNFEHSWDIEHDLPWDALSPLPIGEPHGPTLDPVLVDAITQRCLNFKIAENGDQRPRGSVIAFLYLYMNLARRDDRLAFTFTARASIPVGAGLGSSASYSTCLSSTLLLLFKHITLPSEPLPSHPPTETTPAHIHISHSGRKAIPKEVAEEVNKWAFVAEKVLHGNPSGVDNCVSVYGGALAFTRDGFTRRNGGMEGIRAFKSVRFLLVDSKIPRDTKKLVAGVGLRKEKEPEVINPILDSIHAISDEARRVLEDTELSRETLLSSLSSLIDENHAHLVSLGVSHPSLESIRSKTAEEPFRLHTKLTGAGGGGCAVTLIPDGFEDSKLSELIQMLRQEGFEAYQTSIGGSGFGVFRDRPSPPNGVNAKEEEGSLREKFLDAKSDELGNWGKERGRWLYV